MTTTNQVALDRLLAITWSANDSRINSHVALFKEYLRRSALWATALKCTELWPFFDVAGQIFPDSFVPQDMIDLLNQHLKQFHGTRLIKQTCQWYLHWQQEKLHLNTSKEQLPDPYEPLILMYERGATFYTEHGFFCVSIASFSRQDITHYQEIKPLLSLESSFLDYLDQSEKLESKSEQLSPLVTV